MDLAGWFYIWFYFSHLKTTKWMNKSLPQNSKSLFNHPSMLICISLEAEPKPEQKVYLRSDFGSVWTGKRSNIKAWHYGPSVRPSETFWELKGMLLGMCVSEEWHAGTWTHQLLHLRGKGLTQDRKLVWIAEPCLFTRQQSGPSQNGRRQKKS